MEKGEITQDEQFLDSKYIFKKLAAEAISIDF